MLTRLLTRLLCRFAYVKRLRAAIADLVSVCPRCAGSGILHTPGATIRCLTCAKYRKLIDREVPARAAR